MAGGTNALPGGSILLVGETLSRSQSSYQYPNNKASEETLNRAMRWPMRAASAYIVTIIARGSYLPYLERTDSSCDVKSLSLQQINTSLLAKLWVGVPQLS